MSEIYQGLVGAFDLIISFDPETYSIILLSLKVSFLATIIGGVIGALIGLILGIKEFRMKNIFVRIMYMLMGLPPVVLGLIVMLFISRKGPLGFMKLIYTPNGMIIAQCFLVAPIVAGNVFNFTNKKGMEVLNLGKTLGAGKIRQIILLISEMKGAFVGAFIAGYGRAVSEVGAVSVVGGNIKGHTRVMTTSISMLQSMGKYDQAIAMGIVLLLISFVVQSILFNIQKG